MALEQVQQVQAPQANADDVITVLKEQIGNLNYSNIVLSAQLKKSVEENTQLKESLNKLTPADDSGDTPQEGTVPAQP